MQCIHVVILGQFLAAAVCRMRTARSEAASLGQVYKAAGFAAHKLLLLAAQRGVEYGGGGHKPVRVRMQRVGGYRLRGAELHKFAKVHYRNAVAYIAQHVKVVRYDKIGQAEMLLQIEQQIEYLRLDGHVERADGLVADDQFGIARQPPGQC